MTELLCQFVACKNPGDYFCSRCGGNYCPEHYHLGGKNVCDMCYTAQSSLSTKRALKLREGQPKNRRARWRLSMIVNFALALITLCRLTVFPDSSTSLTLLLLVVLVIAGVVSLVRFLRASAD